MKLKRETKKQPNLAYVICLFSVLFWFNLLDRFYFMVSCVCVVSSLACTQQLHNNRNRYITQMKEILLFFFFLKKSEIIISSRHFHFYLFARLICPILFNLSDCWWCFCCCCWVFLLFIFLIAYWMLLILMPIVTLYLLLFVRLHLSVYLIMSVARILVITTNMLWHYMW